MSDLAKIVAEICEALQGITDTMDKRTALLREAVAVATAARIELEAAVENNRGASCDF